MNYTQAAKRVSDMPASVVPDWIKGMALAFEERGVAGNTLIAFVEKVEQKVSGGTPLNVEFSGGPTGASDNKYGQGPSAGTQG